MTTATPEASAPESIVVSLEWAKKLREAGWPQNGHHFSFGGRLEDNNFVLMYGMAGKDTFAAPTAEEILRRLPTFLQLEDGAYDLRILKMTGHFNVWYSRADTVFPEGGVMENSLANASAAMYVYLAENKLLPTP